MRTGRKYKYKPINFWVISLFIGLLFLSLFWWPGLLSPKNAIASKEPSNSAVYAPPPYIEEVRADVEIFANQVYAEEPGALLDIYVPGNLSENVPVILWIHGGGYIGGSKESRRDYAMTLAHAGFVVANMDYALAPDRLYPGPVVQANEALRYLQQYASVFNGDMTRVFIGGDSAGAQIASQVTAVSTNRKLAEDMGIHPAIGAENLRGALLFCGLYNMETVAETGFPNIGGFLNAYTGTNDFHTFDNIQELSTVRHITSDFPDSFISVGDGDPLAPQSAELASALKTIGVQVETAFFEETGKSLQHEFQYALNTIDGQETLAETIDFLVAKSR